MDFEILKKLSAEEASKMVRLSSSIDVLRSFNDSEDDLFKYAWSIVQSVGEEMEDSSYYFEGTEHWVYLQQSPFDVAVWGMFIETNAEEEITSD